MPYVSSAIVLWFLVLTLPEPVTAGLDSTLGPGITPSDLGTCWNYLMQPCNCGICGFFYQLTDVCSARNLSWCVRGGYYDGGPRGHECCEWDYGRIVLVAAIVVGIVACWCCIVYLILLLKRLQRRKRQRGTLEEIDNNIFMDPAGGGVVYPPGRYASDYQFGDPYDPNYPRSSSEGPPTSNHRMEADTVFDPTRAAPGEAVGTEEGTDGSQPRSEKGKQQ